MILGSGGRENAILNELIQYNDEHRFFCASANAQMAQNCESLGPIALENIKNCITENSIDLVIVGPEKPLVDGLADAARKAGALVFGPSREAAQLEGSKVFAKNFMQEFSIPTAFALEVKSVADVETNLDKFTAPYVLKADGLCAGKGVFICKTKDELIDAANKIFEEQIFGKQTALLEQFKSGHELSFFFLTNGTEGVSLPLFRDHKRLLDFDNGPNTGGMGVVGPVDAPNLLEMLEDKIMAPTLAGFKKRSYDYRGVVFVGIMMTEEGPSVLEYNVRFGDPETQCIFPSLDANAGDDWLTALTKISEGKIPNLKWRKEKIACVVGAAAGYPDKPEKNIPIEGDPFLNTENSYVLHAGTKEADDKIVTSGGRVLNYIGIGETYKEALDRAYELTKGCHFKGMQYRKDIGHSLL